MLYSETAKHLSLKALSCPMTEEELYFLNKSSLDHHREVEQDRLILLPAFQEAVGYVLNKFIDREQRGYVLEIGCGHGFFYKWLSPEWLKYRLICMDINPFGLKDLKQSSPQTQTAHASCYRLPFRNASLDVIIGYSSFDSLINLDRVLGEVKRTLKPKGKLITFQDLTTDIYQLPNEKRNLESVERYHQKLVEEVKEGGYRILAGETDMLEHDAVEPFDTISSRVELDTGRRNFPILVIWDRGGSAPLLRKRTREEIGITKLEAENAINSLIGDGETQKLLNERGCHAGDVLECIRMRYLVAEV